MKAVDKSKKRIAKVSVIALMIATLIGFTVPSSLEASYADNTTTVGCVVKIGDIPQGSETVDKGNDHAVKTGDEAKLIDEAAILAGLALLLILILLLTRKREKEDNSF